MKPASRIATPLLATLLLVVATAACQREAEDIMATPTDDVPAVTPSDNAPGETMPMERPPLPPPQPDPCAGLSGAGLDDCLQRQMEQASPPLSEQLPPIEADTPTPPQPSPY